MLSVAGIGVAAAVWCVLSPVGRSAEAVAGLPTGPARLAASVRAAVPRRSTPTGDADRVRVAIAQVAALLRTGAPPGAAWTRALGVPVREDGIPDRAGLARVLGSASSAQAVVGAARLARDVGAPLGGVLEAVGATLVDQVEAESEREASLAGPRTTARVLFALPVLGVVIGWVLGADPLATAVDGGLGSAAVVTGLLALVAGRWWTARLVAAARSAGADS